jgi:uncharacterized iron-regulated membrane protein
VRRLSLARWSTLHRWLGIGLGLWFALVGLTGTLLVWRDEVDGLLNPAWFQAPASSGPTLPVDDLIERVRAAQPSLGRIERLRFPDTPGQALRLQVRGALARVEAARLELFVDPATGTVLGQRGLDRLSLTRADAMRTLYEFHRNVLLGEPGSNIVGVAGCLLLTSAVSGLVLAWPRSRERWKGLLRIAWRSNATRVAFDVHRSSGALLAVLVLLATITGTTLVWPNYVRDAVASLSRVEPIPVLPFSVAQGDEEPLPLQALLERVLAAFPGHRVAELRLSERGLTGVLFQLRDDGLDVHRLAASADRRAAGRAQHAHAQRRRAVHALAAAAARGQRLRRTGPRGDGGGRHRALRAGGHGPVGVVEEATGRARGARTAGDQKTRQRQRRSAARAMNCTAPPWPAHSGISAAGSTPCACSASVQA